MASTSPAATVDDIRKDMQALRDDVTRLAEQVSALLTASGDEAMGEVKERLRRLRDNMGEAVTDAGGRGRDALMDVTDNLGEAIEDAVQEHPLTTIALAVGLGFLFGTAWRR